jgi:hypothetical protein
MAWTLFNSPSTINPIPASNQYLSYEQTSSGELELAAHDPHPTFPFSKIIHMGGSPRYYDQGYHSNSMTAHPSSQFLLHLGQNPSQNFPEEAGDLEYVEKAIFSNPQCLDSSPPASSSLLSKENRKRHTTRELTTHRVEKKRYEHFNEILLYIILLMSP